MSSFIDSFNPEIICLQETKVQDLEFPREFFDERGYNIAIWGQKTFNGVAILSKRPFESLSKGLTGQENEQARWIEAYIPSEKCGVLRVCSLYLPNGNPCPGEKYDYKLHWMEAMRIYVQGMLDEEIPIILAGDYNVIPTHRDAARPEKIMNDATFILPTRQAYGRILSQGWVDAYRVLYPESESYTFWDYKGQAWAQNFGLGIDMMLLSPQAADLLQDSGIEKEERDREKPSDHVPVWCTLDA
jgi:exodeoxyribonuclease-3